MRPAETTISGDDSTKASGDGYRYRDVVCGVHCCCSSVSVRYPRGESVTINFFGLLLRDYAFGLSCCINPNPCGNGYHRISDINRGKSQIKTMSRLGFREPSISEPAIFTHTPREICPSKFHNNSPIPHTQVRFASLFLPALSSEVVVTLLHNTF